MSFFFDSYSESMLGTDVHSRVVISSDNLKFVCVDHTDDNPAQATDQDLDDILAAGRVATSANLTGKTITDGAFDHTDETLSAVSGDQFESINYYKDSGVDTTSPLMCKIDSGTGLPFTPSGGDIIVRPNASGVFSL